MDEDGTRLAIVLELYKPFWDPNLPPTDDRDSVITVFNTDESLETGATISGYPGFDFLLSLHRIGEGQYELWGSYAPDSDLENLTLVDIYPVEFHDYGGSVLLVATVPLDDMNNPESVHAFVGSACYLESGDWYMDYLPNSPPPVEYEISSSAQPFVDVPSWHSYRTAIEGMAAAGIIAGYDVTGGKEFRPYNPVWRWQFAKMICGAMGIPVSEGLVSSFPDLGPDDPAVLWPHDYVAAATGYGIIQGFPDGTFGAYKDISRAQVITMVVRAVKSQAPGALTIPPSPYLGSLGAFSEAHQENMRIAEYNDLLAGLVGFGPSWDPWAKMSRGEVAQVLWNMMGM